MGITGFGSPGAKKLKDVKKDKTGNVVMETAVSGLTTTGTGTITTNTTATGNRNNVSLSYNIAGAEVSAVSLNQNGTQMGTLNPTIATALTTTGTTVQTSTTATEYRNNVSMQYSVAGATGTVKLLQNGSTMASTTFTATPASGTLTFTTATPPESPTLTGAITLTATGTLTASFTGGNTSGVIDYYTPTPPTSPTLTGSFVMTATGTASATFNINGVRSKFFDDFMPDVRRDANGSVVTPFDTLATGMQVTATTTGVSATNNTTTPGRPFVTMSWSNVRGSGADVALLANGSAVDSVTGQTEGANGDPFG